MKKRNLFFLIILPFLLLVSVFAFRTSLKLTFVDWTLREYCKKNLGYHLSYEKMSLLQYDIILIEGLSLVPADPGVFSAGALSCPGVYLKMDLDLRNKVFYSQVHMQNFEVNTDQWPIRASGSSGLPAGSRGFIVAPYISVSGEGGVRWDGRLSGCQFDLKLADDITGIVQIEELAIDIAGSGEFKEFVFKGRDLNANKISGLAQALFPDWLPGSIKRGSLSGALVLRGGALFGAVSAENLQAEYESLYLTFPYIEMAVDRGKGQLDFQSALVESPCHRATDINGTVKFDRFDWSLQGGGKLRGMKLTADVASSGLDFREGSQITIQSDDTFGKISLSGVCGKADYSGSSSLFGLPFAIDRMDIQADFARKENGLLWRGRADCAGARHSGGAMDFEVLTARDLSLLKGKFSGKNIPVEMLGAFPLGRKEMAVAGKADVEGVVRGSTMTIHGITSDLSLRERDWSFSLGSAASIDLNMDYEKEWFDISGDIESGKFVYSTTGFVLDNISTSFRGTGSRIVFENLQALFGNVEVGGDVAMTLDSAADIEIYQHSLRGKVSDVKDMLAKLGVRSSLFSLPLSGELSCRDDGAFFKWNGASKQLSGTIGAALYDGTLDFSDYDLLLCGLELDFVYDISSDSLDVRGGGGEFSLGTGEIHDFVVDKFVCSELSEGVVDFDFWCGDKKRDKIRVCGKTEKENGDLAVRFDKEATHFGALYPDNLTMVFSGGVLKTWQLDMSFSWEEAEGELRQLLETRIVPFRQNFLMLLSNSQIAQGDFGVSVGYDGGRGLMDYRICGKDLDLGSRRVNQFKFIGNCCSDKWRIQKCELDDLSIAADLSLDNGCCLVSFLGCRLGNVSLLGMDGKFYPERSEIEANLNLVEINLAELSKIQPLKGFINKYRPQGEARATSGKLNVVMGDKDWDIALSFVASLKDFSLQGTPFRDFDKISVDYQTDKKLAIKSISSEDGSGDAVRIELDSSVFDLSCNEISVEGLHFFIPSSRLDWTANFMRTLFPGAVNSALANFVGRIKGRHSLEGVLNFELNPVSSLLSVAFSDGVYEFFDNRYSLRDFHFIKRGQEIEIGAQCLALNQWYNLETKFQGKTFPSGILELSCDGGGEAPPLEISWKTAEALTFEKVRGSLAGYQINLVPSHSVLKGSVKREDFYADLEVAADRILFQNAQGSVMKGFFSCPSAAAFRKDRRWEIFVPEVYARGLKIGRLEGWEEFLDDTVTIDTLELSDIRGPLEDFSGLSCTGRVSFSSEGKPRKMFPFVKEKIKNISALKPFSGEFDFTFNSGNFIVSGLRDIVDGRYLFRYTLPQRRQNTLDIHGNVSMIFNLLPHNPKVRVGDLISVIIEGTVDSPEFFIRKTEDVANHSELP